MKHDFCRLALVDNNLRLGKQEANYEQVKQLLKQTSDSDLVVFPLLPTVGITAGDVLRWQETAVRQKEVLLKLLQTQSKEGTAYVLFSLIANVEQINQKLVLLIDPRGQIVKAYLQPLTTKEPLILQITSTLQVILSQASERYDLYAYEEQALASLSKTNAQVIAYVKPSFGESSSEACYVGKRLLFEEGNLIAKQESKKNDPNILTYDVDLYQLACYQAKQKEAVPTHSFIQTKCTDEYDLTKLATEIPELKEFCLKDAFSFTCKEKQNVLRVFNTSPFLSGVVCDLKTESQAEKLDFILDKAAKALNTRLDLLSFNEPCKVVLGLSGGLDSTCALLIAVRAMKQKNRSNKDIITLSMPGFGTSDLTHDNSYLLAKALGCDFSEVPIGDIVADHLASIGHGGLKQKDITLENAQARERTQILMDVANMKNGIVLGTGDLSEECLGFCTYNGDHMAMYNINSSIPKTLMQQIVLYEAKKLGEENQEAKAVLERIVSTPISPELIPTEDKKSITQTTESIVGPYELHDYFSYLLLKYGLTAKDDVVYRVTLAFAGKYEATEVAKWYQEFKRRFKNSQFKRSCAPDGVALGTVNITNNEYGLSLPSDLYEL